jgi:hypothetical protein
LSCVAALVLYILFGVPIMGVATGATMGGDSGFIVIPMVAVLALPLAPLCGAIVLWPGVATLLPGLERSWPGLVVASVLVEIIYLVALGVWFWLFYALELPIAEALVFGFAGLMPMGGAGFLFSRIGDASLRPGVFAPDIGLGVEHRRVGVED